MRALVEAVTLIALLGTAVGTLARVFVSRRRKGNLDHVHELEHENEEMDEIIRRLNRERQ